MISIDFVFALIGLALCLILGFGGIALAVWMRRRDREGIWVLPMFMSILGLVLAIPGFAFGLFPYDMQYHSYRPVAGEVAEVQSRLRSSDDGTTQSFVVRLTADRTLYRCDDTRCALLKPGQHVELNCMREWEYGSTDGWKCRYDQEG